MTIGRWATAIIVGEIVVLGVAIGWGSAFGDPLSELDEGKLITLVSAGQLLAVSVVSFNILRTVHHDVIDEHAAATNRLRAVGRM